SGDRLLLTGSGLGGFARGLLGGGGGFRLCRRALGGLAGGGGGLGSRVGCILGGGGLGFRCLGASRGRGGALGSAAGRLGGFLALDFGLSPENPFPIVSVDG